MTVTTVVAIVSFSAGFAYLFDFFRFATTLAQRFPEDWDRLGRPEKLGVVGQLKYLGVVFGVLRVSDEAKRYFRAQLIRIRVLAIVVTIGLAILYSLTA